MPERPPSEQKPDIPVDRDVIVYGRLALAFGSLALISALLHLRIYDPHDLARPLVWPHGRGPWWGLAARVTDILHLQQFWEGVSALFVIALVAGWCFLFCGYSAHGLKGPWKMGCAALVVLLAATAAVMAIFLRIYGEA